eukprot:TRINITY_DN9931_c0_g1_i2.p1 TRINITY_DN9931_c0_g1~~TRINITY_DN9931_c0_g1_i2.p1  ORF type:complete len:557 (+),score=63.62 TRINITY_DN9931_c0_g1_i2:42-1712(+)
MEPRLIARGKVCQGAYLSGSRLEFEVTFVCTSDPAAGEVRSAVADKAYDGDHIADLFEKAECISADGDDVTILASSTQLIGLCLADSTWINKIDTFTDTLSGPLDPPHQKEEDNQSWGIWSWLSGRPDQSIQKVQWDNQDTLPRAAVGAGHINSQTTLEANPEELLPRNTKMRLGELRKFKVTVQLPVEIPPTYHGYSLRYTYYVFACAIWSCGDVHHECVLKIPFTIWNPAASMRPMRPPFCRLSDNHNFECHVKEIPPTGQSLCNQRAALPCFVEDSSQFMQYPVDCHSPLFDSKSPSFPADEGGVISRGGSNTFSPSPSSLMGELLGEGGTLSHDNNIVEEVAKEDPFVHLNSFNAIEQLTSVPHQHETETIVEHKGIPFLRLTTHGMHYTLGDSATGLLSVVENSVCKCVRVAIKLEYEEQVPTDLFKSGTFVPSPKRQFPKLEVKQEKYVNNRTVQTRTVDEHNEIMYDCEESSFEFVILPQYPPTMYTDKVAVEWFISFEFYYILLDNNGIHKPTRLECEQPIIWRLPLHIHVTPDTKSRHHPTPYVYAM